MQPQPAPLQSWFCPRCGHANLISAAQCSQCGTPTPYQAHYAYGYAPQPQPVVIVAAPKSRTAYILLGLFLGGIGVHNFYAGHIGRAVTQLIIGIINFLLIITIIGIILAVPLMFAMFIWIIIDVVTVDTDDRGIKMV